MQRSLLLLVCLTLTWLTACVTAPPEATYGVQPDHLGYVPARIAILPCRTWPVGARFAKLPLSNTRNADLASLCTAVDQFVLSGFNQQPYMKGFSPKFVLKSLADARPSAAPLPERLPQVWAHQPGVCLECSTAPAFYAASLAKRPEWLSWLNDLSKGAHNADSILLPFVTYAYEKRFGDRGLEVAERGAGVTLLLVDTNNGMLLWAGGREAAVPAKRLEGGNVHETLAYPPWTEALERLFTEDLWREFPGRQVF